MRNFGALEGSLASPGGDSAERIQGLAMTGRLACTAPKKKENSNNKI